MVRTPRGRASLGCLVLLLALAVVAYAAVDVGEAYWRYYEFNDAMRQEARFAEHRTADEIQQRLRSYADSLGLPDDARRVRVELTPKRITISAQYDEHVKLPFSARDFHFSPKAEWIF